MRITTITCGLLLLTAACSSTSDSSASPSSVPTTTAPAPSTTAEPKMSDSLKSDLLGCVAQIEETWPVLSRPAQIGQLKDDCKLAAETARAAGFTELATDVYTQLGKFDRVTTEREAGDYMTALGVWLGRTKAAIRDA